MGSIDASNATRKKKSDGTTSTDAMTSTSTKTVVSNSLLNLALSCLVGSLCQDNNTSLRLASSSADRYPLLGLKRILSFRSSKIFVDPSDTSISTHETTPAPSKPIELPSDSLAELGAACAFEIDGTGTRADGNWAALELDGGLNTWDLTGDASAWQPSIAMVELCSDQLTIQEMPAWLPPELAGDDCQSSATSSASPDPCEVDQESFDLTLLSSDTSLPAAMKIDSHPLTNYGINENSSQSLSTQEYSFKPFLGLDTGSFVPMPLTSLEDQNGTLLYHATAVHYPELQRMGIDFPSPPTSPIPQFEHDTPVSPIEDSPQSFPMSRSSRFSSLSSIMSSLSSSDNSEDANPAARIFDDIEMCFEPDNFDNHTTSPNALAVSYSPSLLATYLPELEAGGDLPVLLHNPDTTACSAEACLHTMNVKMDNVMSDFFAKCFDGSNFEASSSPPGLPRQVGEHWAENDNIDVGLEDINYHSSTDSTSSSPGNDPQHASATSFIKPSTPMKRSTHSLKSKDHRSLSRSPALRAVYRCTYGSCTFEPTGKKAYHKRTLQRHQERCLYSPLPREKKPWKCIFPACNKGFSRLDGLNAHRKTSGHGLKIELQVMEENNQLRDAEGFS